MRGRDEGGRDDQGTKGLEDQGTRGPKKEKNSPKKKKKIPKINTSPPGNAPLPKVQLLMEDIRLTSWFFVLCPHYLQGPSSIPGGCLGFLPSTVWLKVEKVEGQLDSFPFGRPKRRRENFPDKLTSFKFMAEILVFTKHFCRYLKWFGILTYIISCIWIQLMETGKNPPPNLK